MPVRRIYRTWGVEHVILFKAVCSVFWTRSSKLLNNLVSFRFFVELFMSQQVMIWHKLQEERILIAAAVEMKSPRIHCRFVACWASSWDWLGLPGIGPLSDRLCDLGTGVLWIYPGLLVTLKSPQLGQAPQHGMTWSLLPVSISPGVCDCPVPRGILVG